MLVKWDPAVCWMDLQHIQIPVEKFALDPVCISVILGVESGNTYLTTRAGNKSSIEEEIRITEIDIFQLINSTHKELAYLPLCHTWLPPFLYSFYFKAKLAISLISYSSCLLFSWHRLCPALVVNMLSPRSATRVAGIVVEPIIQP